MCNLPDSIVKKLFELRNAIYSDYVRLDVFDFDDDFSYEIELSELRGAKKGINSALRVLGLLK